MPVWGTDTSAPDTSAPDIHPPDCEANSTGLCRASPSASWSALRRQTSSAPLHQRPPLRLLSRRALLPRHGPPPRLGIRRRGTCSVGRFAPKVGSELSSLRKITLAWIRGINWFVGGFHESSLVFGSLCVVSFFPGHSYTAIRHRNNHRLRFQRNHSTEVQRKYLGDGIAREHRERPSYSVCRGISDIDADQPVGEDGYVVIVAATLRVYALEWRDRAVDDRQCSSGHLHFGHGYARGGSIRLHCASSRWRPRDRELFNCQSRPNGEFSVTNHGHGQQHGITAEHAGFQFGSFSRLLVGPSI